MRLRTRILLGVELILGLVPTSAFYIYYSPVGLFWTGSVLKQTTEGIVNAYTGSVAAAFVLGGIGLASLWVVLIGRLLGWTSPGRLVITGLWTAITTGVAVMIFLPIINAWWPDYYLSGAPLIVAVHLAWSHARSSGRRLVHMTERSC